MKKISTAAGKQIRKFSEQKLTIELDLDDRSSWFCVLDEAVKYGWNRSWGRLRKP